MVLVLVMVHNNSMANVNLHRYTLPWSDFCIESLNLMLLLQRIKSVENNNMVYMTD